MRCPTISELPPPPQGKKGWPWRQETPQLPDVMPNGEPWPKISIVTPSYNQGQFIEQTVRSVLLQGYPNLEYIIMDGGSTDISVEIIKKYGKWLAYWVSEPDKGQSNAINKGFNKASGEIYGWLNSDDYFLKNALGAVAMAHRDSPDAEAWCGGSLDVDIHGKKRMIVWPKRLEAEAIARWNRNSFGQPACLFSGKAWRKCGPLDEDLYYGMDFDLWLKIAKEFSFAKINELIAVDRVHKDAKTQRDRGQMYAIQCLIQIRHGYERVAVEDMSQWLNTYFKMEKILFTASRFPLFRPILPIAQIVWRKFFLGTTQKV